MFSRSTIRYASIKSTNIDAGDATPESTPFRRALAFPNIRTLAAFAKNAIKYEAIHFDPSGFSDENEAPNAYEGVPSPENNDMWEKLIAVGNYVLTKEEHDKLDIETAELMDRPGEYLITLEVFHQLHCLDYLRQASYATAMGMGMHHEHESEWSKTKHLSHCVDYLRQVIMCHGDLTPITLKIRNGHYLPNFRIKHTCRNFDSIYEFAERRNTSGFGIA
ncbi:hypothetical protein BGZ60DRAFT_532709 [Tricladium varicosporioides]|nr:hypothetical protein BGZ60DRAFT_532709 [Hymenoscyphus varicosporioides]